TAPIIGPRTLEQLDGTMRTLAVELGDEALAKLGEIFPVRRTAPEDYAREGGQVTSAPTIAMSLGRPSTSRNRHEPWRPTPGGLRLVRGSGHQRADDHDEHAQAEHQRQQPRTRTVHALEPSPARRVRAPRSRVTRTSPAAPARS